MPPGRVVQGEPGFRRPPARRDADPARHTAADQDADRNAEGGSDGSAETDLVRERIDRVIRQHGGRADALIEVLHLVQEIRGHLPRADLEQVARGLSLPLSRVYGVATFYHLFHLEAPTAHRCAVCLGTACYVRGGSLLVERLQERLGLRLDEPEPGGDWSLRHVSCLGACGQAPVLVVDGVMNTRLPVDHLEALDVRLDEAGLPRGETAP
jgi:NADH:ubiquinone oxidoreductase subunit E